MDKKLYLLAEFDEDTQIVFKEFEKIIVENGFSGEQTKDIPYHITLCSFPPNYEDNIDKLLEEVKCNFREIPITLSSLGLFGLRVLFFNPDMNARLIELFDFVKKDSFEEDEFLAAHATLLLDKPEIILTLLPKIAEKFKRISGKIKYLSLYEFFPARFIKRIELGV